MLRIRHEVIRKYCNLVSLSDQAHHQTLPFISCWIVDLVLTRQLLKHNDNIHVEKIRKSITFPITIARLIFDFH